MNHWQRTQLITDLENSTPLIGWLVQRRAASQLAKDPTTRSTQALAQAALNHPDSSVRKIARRAVEKVSNQAGVDAVCQVWQATRSPWLANLIAEKGWMAPITPLPPAHTSTILAIEALPSTQAWLSASVQGEIRFHAWPDSNSSRKTVIHPERITSLRHSPDAASMATCNQASNLALWDLRPLQIPGRLINPWVLAQPPSQALCRVC